MAPASRPRSPHEGADATGPAPIRSSSALPSTDPPQLSLADGVALVRAVLAESTTPPRWPMYLRQMKQFIRTARPDFDERRYGSLPDLLRACQKDGLLRLERDRQGGLRAFAGSYKPSNVPHGWGTLGGAEPQGGQEEADGENEMETGGGFGTSRCPRIGAHRLSG